MCTYSYSYMSQDFQLCGSLSHSLLEKKAHSNIFPLWPLHFWTPLLNSFQTALTVYVWQVLTHRIFCHYFAIVNLHSQYCMSKPQCLASGSLLGFTMEISLCIGPAVWNYAMSDDCKFVLVVKSCFPHQPEVFMFCCVVSIVWSCIFRQRRSSSYSSSSESSNETSDTSSSSLSSSTDSDSSESVWVHTNTRICVSSN